MFEELRRQAYKLENALNPKLSEYSRAADRLAASPPRATEQETAALDALRSTEVEIEDLLLKVPPGRRGATGTGADGFPPRRTQLSEVNDQLARSTVNGTDVSYTVQRFRELLHDFQLSFNKKKASGARRSRCGDAADAAHTDAGTVNSAAFATARRTH
jgi:hypothetical protein